MINEMVELWGESRPWAAVTSYVDGLAHPFLASRDALELATRTPGDKVLGRLLIESDDERVVRLECPFARPRDVNTPEEYDALLEAAARTSLEDE